MLKTIFIIALGLILPLVSLLLLRKAKQRARARLRRARYFTALRQQQSLQIRFNYDDNLEANRCIVGDPSCRFNARSPYIRCAVNPEGPCQNCRHYEPKEIKN